MAKPKTNTDPKREKTTVSLVSESHRRASIAATLVSEDLLTFLSRAADDRSLPILKKHGVKLPDDAAVSQGA